MIQLVNGSNDQNLNNFRVYRWDLNSFSTFMMSPKGDTIECSPQELAEILGNPSELRTQTSEFNYSWSCVYDNRISFIIRDTKKSYSDPGPEPHDKTEWYIMSRSKEEFEEIKEHIIKLIQNGKEE